MTLFHLLAAFAATGLAFYGMSALAIVIGERIEKRR